MANEWKHEKHAVGMCVMHADGRLIATVHEEPYAPQIAATPDLYDALDKLTDVCVCLPANTDLVDATWLNDLQTATRNGLAALKKAREG